MPPEFPLTPRPLENALNLQRTGRTKRGWKIAVAAMTNISFADMKNVALKVAELSAAQARK